jgi:uncharacterized protein YqeY
MKVQLKEALKAAMKAQDRVRLDTVRTLLSEIQYEEMQRGVQELGAPECVAVVQRELKKRHEALEFAEKAQRPEQCTQLRAESAVLESLLPRQLDAAQIEGIIAELKGTTPALALPAVMKHLKENFAGQYDGKLASEVAKRVLG